MPGASTGFLLRDGDVAGPGQLAQLLDECGVHDAAGGGAAAYFLVVKPKQGKKAPSALDDLDLEDEEEYLNEDETEETE